MSLKMEKSKALRRKKILEGKVALVTGGASGIGKATALLFAREGAKVSLVDLESRGGQNVVRSIKQRGGKAIFIQADVSRADDCNQAVKKTFKNFGKIDILYNCAGIIRRATVMETSEEEWERVIDINVKSIFLISKSVIPLMDKSGGGVIINVASAWGLVGGEKAAAYCASKGAVVQLTKAMAIDHAKQKIRVNCLCPGDIDTPLLRQEARQLKEPLRKFLKEGARRPLRRIGRPEEIAKAALFLASDASSYMTGASLVIDGGGTAG